jgi:DNA sulfur modification protein DndB
MWLGYQQMKSSLGSRPANLLFCSGAINILFVQTWISKKTYSFPCGRRLVSKSFYYRKVYSLVTHSANDLTSKRHNLTSKRVSPDLPEESDTDPHYTFPAIRGMQAGKEYYSTMCSLRLIPKLFLYDEEELPAELRSQRILNKGRIPAMTRYLVDNPRDYIFSSITASIDGEVRFAPYGDGSKSKIGELIIPMVSTIIINDGQHRRAAIEQALKERPELSFDTISVVFFVDGGLKRSQQMFADLNQHAVRPSKSLGIFYDHRDTFSRFIVRLIEKVPIFKDRVERAKSSISNRSVKFFTLSTVYQANRALLGKTKIHEKVTSEEEEMASEYWTELTNHIPEWKLLMQNKASAYELRKEYIHAHGIALHALGIAGHDLIANHPVDWKKILNKLDNIDWARSNSKIWEGKATIGGAVSKSRTNLVLTSNFIKETLGLPLTRGEQQVQTVYMRPQKENP